MPNGPQQNSDSSTGGSGSAAGPSLSLTAAAARAPVAVVARKQRRPISLTARGEPMVWLTGGTVAASIIMIVGLLAFITYQGFTTFWPSPLAQVTYKVGDKQRTVLGEPFRSERFRPEGAAAGNTIGRTLYRIGNVDLTGERFVWINDDTVVDKTYPKDAVLFERYEWGNAYGHVEAVVANDKLYMGANAWPEFQKQFAPMAKATEELLAITKHELGDVSRRKNEIRLDILGVALRSGKDSPAHEAAKKERTTELADLDKKEQELIQRKNTLTDTMSGVRVYLKTIDGQYIPSERGTPDKAVSAARDGKVRLVDVEPGVTVAQPAEGSAADAPRTVLIHPEAKQPRVEIVDAAGKVVESHVFWPNGTIAVKDGQDAKAGDTLGRQANPLQISQVVRGYQPNAQAGADKAGTYFGRWWEFLSHDPREANTEGGVFPAIIGTVLMTFIMIIFVVPIGVIAAIYLREYAKQGLLVTIIRISVNNLAGVPSIVFGVFGLAFFCYGVGKWIDAGPTNPIPQGQWFVLLVVACALVVGALALSFLAGKRSKDENQTIPSVLKWGGITLWIVAAGTVAYMVAGMPFFKGLYWVEASENTPVVGKSALIWASLTLALLTLPVVIVATEESLSAVPRSMREGSYACGASKWQTIRRIVLPRALPGIMTGMILAVARGAGEVAPLMLVGAVKLAPELPISSSFPFFGSDRSFMHLGFHIYDLGFQSPDSENARPLVFTTTFLLIAIVMLLNFSAMLIRSRLRKAHAGGAF